ncbi:hypothetical protein SANTM175S_09531 [Streptomyces antimycoticus]
MEKAPLAATVAALQPRARAELAELVAFLGRGRAAR